MGSKLHISGIIAVLALLAFLTPRSAFGQGVAIAQSNGAFTTDCSGGDATANGSGDSIIFRNGCRTLTVNGNGNSIRVELKSPGTINLNGNGNTVRYAPIDGSADVNVIERGQGNTVQRVAAIPGGTAAATGSVTAPDGLSVHGANGESVVIGPGGIVATPAPGTGQTVTITPNGIAAQGGPTAATAAISPGQLMLSGDGQNRDVSCTEANVYIKGNGGHFTLHGGCKALFIQGNDDFVHVELIPATQIAIQGDNAQVYFLVAPAGRDPSLLVTGTNSRAFRVHHLDDANGEELQPSVKSGAIDTPIGGAIGMAASVVPVAFATPQAALAFARDRSDSALRADLGAVQTPQGTQVSLPGDVLFDFDKEQLRLDAQRSLAELSVLIARGKPKGLRIVGYTDGIGSPQYNLELSDRRARNVERWLLNYGRVQLAALDVEGRAAAAPVAPNTLPDGKDNPMGRQQNRRVEILLMQ
jgi:outer membrane protein OmpA-like peptidoglycan-associated protein